MSGMLGRPALQAVALLLCLLAAARAQFEEPIIVEPVRVESGLEEQWGYVAVRPVHAEMFAWMGDMRDGASTATLARMQEAATSGTLPRAMSALVAARETGTSVAITLERRAEVTSAALAVLADRRLGWGAGPLASAAVESSAGSGFARRLLEQFGDDGVKHNGTRGADLFRLGMIADPQGFRPALLEGWVRTPAPAADAPESQERVMLASLLLSLAVDAEPDYSDPAQSWLSLALSPPTLALPDRFGTMSPAEQSAALGAARAFAGRRWAGDNLATEISTRNRERAWVLLELVEPVPEDALLSILQDAHEERYDRFHAACTLAVRKPASLGSARGLDALAALAVEDYWRTPRIAGMLAEVAGRGVADCGSEGAASVVADALVTPIRGGTPDPGVCGGVLDRINADFVRRLEIESRPTAQIGLWNFLLASGGGDATVAISNAAVTNLVADDETGNAVEARWALARLGAEALPAAEAGLRVAEELGDWQLAAICADIVAEQSPDQRLPRQDRLVEYMVRQLSDDETEGNAASAVRYLARCGDWADEALRHAAEHGDWQQRMHAARLLEARR